MTEDEAVAAAVTAEQQVVYGYGVAGAHLRGADLRRARAAYDRHRLRRDQLAGLLVQAHAQVPVAAPAYVLPFPVADATSARRLCAHLEDGCAGAAWDLVAASAPGRTARSLGVRWLTEAATAATGWRGAAGEPPLPGAPGS